MATRVQYSPFATSVLDRIDALGEAALLASIRRWLGDASPPSPQGIGDDCAVWPQPPPGAQLLFTTDAVVYGRHFDATCPPELAASKLLKRNLSDIAAMGGTPHSALLALTLPRNLGLGWLERFYLGLRDCSLRYKTPVTGGDITEGTDNFFAAHITLIGHAQRPLLRTGANVGDHLFVTGALGGSIHGHHLHFEPRLAEGRWLAAQPDVRAMIDITDGLAKDLPQLLEAAETGEAGAASPHVEMSSEHFQAKGQCCPPDGEKTKALGEGAPSTAIALLDLASLPLTAVAQAATAAADTASGSAESGAVSSAITHALLDGEDYELLFAVDAATDPAEFVTRWQQHFGQTEAPTGGTQTRPQAAYPYCIGKIGSVHAHSPDAMRLYNAATTQPLALPKNGFEHLKT